MPILVSLPNVLTFSRIALIPFICWFITVGTADARFFAALLFGVASLTDYFDGYIAHRMRAKTELGSFLDPLADKLLICTVFSTLVISGYIQGVSLIAVGLTLFRELLMLVLRPSTRVPLPVIPVAKWKTAFQMLSAFLFLQKSSLLLMGAVITLWVSTILSLISALYYLKKVTSRK